MAAMVAHRQSSARDEDSLGRGQDARFTGLTDQALTIPFTRPGALGLASRLPLTAWVMAARGSFLITGGLPPDSNTCHHARTRLAQIAHLGRTGISQMATILHLAHVCTFRLALPVASAATTVLGSTLGVFRGVVPAA